MHAEMKKKPSLDTCSSSRAAPELRLAAAGTRYRTVWVLMTPACLTGRMVRWIGARALTWSGLLAAGVLAAGYALQRSFPAGLVMLAIYAMPIAMLNTAVAPLLMDAAPREYLGRVMAVFMPVNQFASMFSVVVSGWLTSTVLRSFRASFAGITVNSVSLIFIMAGALIFASGVRAFAALPGTNVT